MSITRRQWGEDSTVRQELSAGASVTLSFKGNLFELTAAEQALMTDLTNTFQKYRLEANGKQTPATVER